MSYDRCAHLRNKLHHDVYSEILLTTCTTVLTVVNKPCRVIHKLNLHFKAWRKDVMVYLVFFNYSKLPKHWGCLIFSNLFYNFKVLKCSVSIDYHLQTSAKKYFKKRLFIFSLAMFLQKVNVLYYNMRWQKNIIGKDWWYNWTRSHSEADSVWFLTVWLPVAVFSQFWQGCLYNIFIVFCFLIYSPYKRVLHSTFVRK